MNPENSEQFASDNYAGMCPEALDYLVKANAGSAGAYGRDEWTQRAADALRELFATDCEVFFTATGTAANALALASLCRSYQSVICHEFAHIETDECGAPGFFSGGSKLLLGQGRHGKLTPEAIEALAGKRSDIHFARPGAISLTQPTELGTLYSEDDLSAIQAMAERYRLRIHMDGARFANAVAAMEVKPADITWRKGVDVLCFGGTKNGLGFGEAVLFFDRDLAEGFDHRCKQAGQLISKMRFVAAPWLGFLETGAWLENARHANQCAAYLESRLRDIEGLEIMFPRQANTVFVKLPEPVIRGLREKDWQFYTFIGVGGVRLMCSWKTTPARIDALVKDIEAGMAAGP
jgi:threonine aldolase